ncbi:MAG: alpha amylase C-terminal domain-containing protein, partial [Oscillospiraceae bacterium]
YEEIFTSDGAEFGGTGVTNGKAIKTVDEPLHGFEQSVSLTLPENTVFFLRCAKKKTVRKLVVPKKLQNTNKVKK